MLTPQYSLRHLLLLVTLSAVVCFVPAVAAQGHLWAVALSVALFAAMVFFVIQGLLCVVTRAIGMVIGRRRASAAGGGKDR